MTHTHRHTECVMWIVYGGAYAWRMPLSEHSIQTQYSDIDSTALNLGAAAVCVCVWVSLLRAPISEIGAPLESTSI